MQSQTLQFGPGLAPTRRRASKPRRSPRPGWGAGQTIRGHNQHDTTSEKRRRGERVQALGLMFTCKRAGRGALHAPAQVPFWDTSAASLCLTGWRTRNFPQYLISPPGADNSANGLYGSSCTLYMRESTAQPLGIPSRPNRPHGIMQS
jgi:hypothetical protein